MSEETMTLAEIRRLTGDEEEMGFDTPFVTFTWAHWLHMQAQVLQGFSRFQRAIDQHEARPALLVVLEMQETMTELYKEACTWVVRQPDTPIQGVHETRKGDI
jgi:hypothetical protein